MNGIDVDCHRSRIGVMKRHCPVCNEIMLATGQNSDMCHNCRSAKLLIQRTASAMMTLHGIPLASGICEDCGTRPATCRDHRHYGAPLKVAYVCSPCNAKRGAALDLHTLIKAHRGMLRIEEAAEEANEAPAETEDCNQLLPVNLDEHMAKVEKEILIKALQANRHNRTRTAKSLGISFRSIRYKLEKHGISE